jgi:SAM-dependent methyltransferase
MVGDKGGRGSRHAQLRQANLTRTDLTADAPTGDAVTKDALIADMRSAYDAAGAGWAAGPEQVYAQLARALIAAVPVPLSGSRVLDLGAGTGAAGRAAQEAGAREVVALDLTIGMLRGCPAALHPVAGDATMLPFKDGSFDLVVAAFCLGHLHSISVALSEARRVGLAIAASAFAPGWTHQAKAAVDDALRPFGYQPPAWYTSLKNETESQAADPALLARHAAAVGFTDMQMRTITCPTGLSTPAQLASWRLGMAHVAAFVASLDAPRRAAARQAAEHAVADSQPLVVSMAVFTAR